MYEVEITQDPEIVELMEFEKNLEILEQELQYTNTEQANPKIKELVDMFNILRAAFLYSVKKRG